MAYNDYAYGEAPEGTISNIELLEYGSTQQTPPMKNAFMLDLVENHLSCGVCQYPCHRVVVTNCGHKFCKLCLENDMKIYKYMPCERQQCPTCTKGITSIARVYDDDRMIRSIMDNFAPDLTGIYAAARKRKEGASLKAENRKYERKWERARRRCYGMLAVFCVIIVTGTVHNAVWNPERLSEQVAQIKTVLGDVGEGFFDVKKFIGGIMLKMETAFGKYCMSSGRITLSSMID